MPQQPRRLEQVRREVVRNARRVRNGIRLATGGASRRTGQTPMDVVWRNGRTELWHYRSDTVTLSPPLLIVYSLFSRSYILDLSPGNSVVEQLLDAGFDVYLLDWGVPDERDAGNRIEDYVDEFLPAGLDAVRRHSGHAQVNVLGYCFGGTVCVLHAARAGAAPAMRSLTVMATPVDFGSLGPLTGLFLVDGFDVDTLLGTDGNVPASQVRQAFQALTPTADLATYVNLWDRLWNDDYVAAHQAMTGWATDHIPLAGGVARQLAQLVKDNALVGNRLVLGGEAVHLADVTVPFLCVVAERDHIVPEASAAPLIELVGSTDKQSLRLPGGHVGLLVGRTAATTTIPTIVEFLRGRSEVRE